jgi:hypothetical protein
VHPYAVGIIRRGYLSLLNHTVLILPVEKYFRLTRVSSWDACRYLNQSSYKGSASFIYKRFIVGPFQASDEHPTGMLMTKPRVCFTFIYNTYESVSFATSLPSLWLQRSLFFSHRCIASYTYRASFPNDSHGIFMIFSDYS